MMMVIHLSKMGLRRAPRSAVLNGKRSSLGQRQGKPEKAQTLPRTRRWTVCANQDGPDPTQRQLQKERKRMTSSNNSLNQLGTTVGRIPGQGGAPRVSDRGRAQPDLGRNGV